MMETAVSILYEDNHCLACDKPAGVPTQADESGDLSLLEQVRERIRVRDRKPGNVFLGLLHRLDRPVSGVVLFAKTSKAAARLSEQFRVGTIEKTYLAIVEGTIAADEGEFVDRLSKDRERNVVSIADANDSEGREARLLFRVIERSRVATTVEIKLLTGRSHQIRVQFASRGKPIWGDHKYGSKRNLRALDGGGRIALHARSLGFNHPTRLETLSIDAPIPADWPE